MKNQPKYMVAISFAVAAFLPLGLAAQSAYYSGYQQPQYSQQGQYQASHPGALLRQGIEKVLSFLEGGGAENRAQLEAFVEREIAPYFDFAYMTRWALGPRARYMNQDQLVQVARQFREMFLGALVQQLSKHDPGRIQYLPPQGNPYRGEMTLSLQSYPARGYPIRLDFDFYRSRDGWKIYDVAANGQSALMAYREFFDQRFRDYQPGSAPGGNPYYRR